MKIVYAEKRNAEKTLMSARHKYENERICAKQNKTKQNKQTTITKKKKKTLKLANNL